MAASKCLMLQHLLTMGLWFGRDRLWVSEYDFHLLMKVELYLEKPK